MYIDFHWKDILKAGNNDQLQGTTGWLRKRNGKESIYISLYILLELLNFITYSDIAY